MPLHKIHQPGKVQDAAFDLMRNPGLLQSAAGPIITIYGLYLVSLTPQELEQDSAVGHLKSVIAELISSKDVKYALRIKDKAE